MLIFEDCGCYLVSYDGGDHGLVRCPLHETAPRLLKACEGLLKAVEFLGHARAASDMAASDLGYDGKGDQWRDYVEPCLLGPYDKAQVVFHLTEAI